MCWYRGDRVGTAFAAKCRVGVAYFPAGKSLPLEPPPCAKTPSRHLAAYLFGKKKELRYCARHETSLSAEEAQASPNARVFEAIAQPERPTCAHTAAPERARAALSVRMAKTIRLSRADFGAIGAPRRFHGSLFSLSVSSLPEGRQHASACVVSKKIAAKAVQRNLLRRRCREAVRVHIRKLAASSPFALVFRAKKAAEHASFADIEQEVSMLIDKIPDTGYNTPQ